MLRTVLVVIFSAIVSTSGVTVLGSTLLPECALADYQLGICPRISGQIAEDSVVLRGDDSTSVSHGANGANGADEGDSGDAADGGSAQSSKTGGRVDMGGDYTADFYVLPLPLDCGSTPVDDACQVSTTVTVSDLVSFTPTVPVQVMQPAGWAVRGMPANFIATASVHVQSGNLLGLPAEVRFTPVSYRWDYGDGTSGSATTGGAVWRDYTAEFTDTDTTHSYEAVGRYTSTVTVDYRAEYRFAGSTWLTVAGLVPATGNALSVVVGRIRTALVAENCLQNPDGVGC
ncbi:hypothetical protein E3T55_18560 [Cryobacterium frigoriphilum]|uniref:PKD domain-containing protein n=1 Tax=Cryobacterium frigoriphilum TaxID=1259150 RepID=A0A4R8ZTW9_9MICO|nr:PKD domain-containing protein [Cryobacterium frigoriphilum]TFD45661.1 hypothetical protein E3T55_18560 [Cryobacterium frigoriphilum]